jgi:hypothetical protein
VILADAITYKEALRASLAAVTVIRRRIGRRDRRALYRAAALVEEARIAQVPIEQSHVDCPSAECDGS